MKPFPKAVWRSLPGGDLSLNEPEQYTKILMDRIGETL